MLKMRRCEKYALLIYLRKLQSRLVAMLTAGLTELETSIYYVI